MPQPGAVSRWLRVCVALILLLFSTDALLAGRQESADVLARTKDLFAAAEGKRLVVPVPNSRSIIIGVDGSSDFFIYVERGSIRGDAINTFYEQLEAGDIDGAYDTFARNSLVTLRVSDYGWNGLGTPMVLDDGGEIQDVFYKVVDQAFQAAEATPEDAAMFLELVRDVILPALEQT